MKTAAMTGQTNASVLAMLLWMSAVWAITLMQPAAGQAPAIDGLSKPMETSPISRPVPRSIALPIAFGPGTSVATSGLDVPALLAEDEAKTGPQPLRIGVIQDFAPLRSVQGDWTQTADGGMLWAAVFRAPGAISIRLRVKPWRPVPGAELMVYDANDPNQAFGPFTETTRAREEFWTPPVFSEAVILEYYLPAPLAGQASAASITVDGLLNQYRDIPGTDSGTGGTLPVELSCHLDVTCYTAWAGTTESNSVGALTYVSSPAAGGFFCSGAMLNRAPNDWTPLFSTARHCGGSGGWSQYEADSAFVFWFYETPTCNGTPPNPATLASTSGAILLVDDPNTDYTLLGLESAVPGGVGFAGWDANYWSNSSAATGIHHPGGTHKRITFGTKTGDVTSCIPAQAWRIANPNGNGEIEPGSSGSPIFDSSHRVRGTGSCASWSCLYDDIAEYGRFDVAFPLLEPYVWRNDEAEWNAYVNIAYSGTEKGTVTQPFNSIGEGVFAVRRGTDYTLFLESGSYGGSILIDKAMMVEARNGTVTIGQ